MHKKDQSHSISECTIVEEQIRVKYDDIPITKPCKQKIFNAFNEIRPIIISGKQGIGKHTLVKLIAQFKSKKFADISPTLSFENNDLVKTKEYFKDIRISMELHPDVANTVFLVDTLNLITYFNAQDIKITLPYLSVVFIIDSGSTSYKLIEMLTKCCTNCYHYEAREVTENVFTKSMRNIADYNNCPSYQNDQIATSEGNFYQFLVGLFTYMHHHNNRCISNQHSSADEGRLTLFNVIGRLLYNKRKKINGEIKILTPEEMNAIPRPEMYYKLEEMLRKNNMSTEITAKFIDENKYQFFGNFNEMVKYQNDLSLMQQSTNNIKYSYDIIDELNAISSMASLITIMSYLYNSNSVSLIPKSMRTITFNNITSYNLKARTSSLEYALKEFPVLKANSLISAKSFETDSFDPLLKSIADDRSIFGPCKNDSGKDQQKFIIVDL